MDRLTLEATTRAVPNPAHRPWLLVALWLALGTTLAVAGALGRVPQLGPAFIASSVIGWSALYLRSESTRRWLDTLPMRWLVAGHAIRLPIGALFLWESGRGQLAPLFATRAGWGDIAIGAAAIVVALGFWRNRRIVGVFALVGLADILVALGTGMYLMFVVEDPLMLAPITRLPYPLLPLAIVPTVILTHLMMLARKPAM